MLRTRRRDRDTKEAKRETRISGHPITRVWAIMVSGHPATRVWARARAWAWVEAVAARELAGQNGNFARLRRRGARANGAAFCSRRRSLLISGRFWYFPAFVSFHAHHSLNSADCSSSQSRCPLHRKRESQRDVTGCRTSRSGFREDTDKFRALVNRLERFSLLPHLFFYLGIRGV